MKKIIKNPIFTFILGSLIFGGIVGVSAYTIFANDIGYTPKDSTWKKSDGTNIENVGDAIDELYSKANNINHMESGEINISFSHSWQEIIISFEKEYTTPPNVFYSYIATNSGGSVAVDSITTTSFRLRYNSFFTDLKSDTVKWIAVSQ